MSPFAFFRAPLLASGLLLAFLATSVEAEGLVAPSDMPEPLNEVGIEQRIGETLPLDAPFVDEAGRAVRLGDYFGDKPVILALVYYDCPMLCSLVMNGLAKTLGVLKFDVGQDLDVVAVSFDARETPEMASEVKAQTVKRYGRPDTADGWHFLTGDDESIQRLTEAVGFRYTYLPESDEFAHAGGITIATPEGTIAQYYYGLEYPPKDVRLALVEAAANGLGTVVDQVLLYCFRYDPSLGKYTAVITRVLRLAGVAFCGFLGLFLWIMFRYERTRSQTHTLGAA